MTPLDVGLVTVVIGGGWIAFHHQLRRARQARIRTEAHAFGGRSDDRE